MTRSEYMNSGLLEDWGVDKVKECINAGGRLPKNYTPTEEIV